MRLTIAFLAGCLAGVLLVLRWLGRDRARWLGGVILTPDGVLDSRDVYTEQLAAILERERW